VPLFGGADSKYCSPHCETVKTRSFANVGICSVLEKID
jgi:hypothetical protein